jgi:hypothetical protein
VVTCRNNKNATNQLILVFSSLFSDLLLFTDLFFFPSLFQVAGCMTKKLSVTMLLSCLVGGDEGERSVV